jgi:cytoskeletal protein CcmA (bactofilin family)
MRFNRRPEENGGYNASGKAVGMPQPEATPLQLNRPVEELRQRAGTAARSVIDAWLTMTGDLESEGDIQVDGQVRGHIRCAQLIVGKDATITGDIIAEEVVVRGKVKGVIRANRVRLQETACVESEIYHQTLSIEDGASYEGQIHRSQEPTKAEDNVECDPEPATAVSNNETLREVGELAA